jgi:endoglucanase
MRITRRTATALLLGAAAAPAIAAPATRPIVPTRGFALPDWLAVDARIPADAALATLHQLGFETIRLPVDPAIVTADFLPKIAAALNVVTSHGFNAILDLHPGGQFDGDQADAAWDRLGDVLAATSPARIYAELLNEPPVDVDVWANLAARLVATIRAKAPNHTLIWGPARVQGIWELAHQKPPADRNLIASVHYYTPMGFTHQAENWDASPLARVHDLPFPTKRHAPAVEQLASTLDAADRQFLDNEFAGPWTTTRIGEDFAPLARWSAAHDIPVLLGEFGVLNFAVDRASRANWIRATRAAAEASGAGWVYWEADQGFGFIDNRSNPTIDHAVVEALLT